MLAELRTKSQITIPKSIINSLNLNIGDTLDIFEKDGMICLVPVAVYPKTYVEMLNQEVNELKTEIAAEKTRVYKTADELINDLTK